MNVERLRSFEPETSGPSRPGAREKGSDFALLMDSVLGSGREAAGSGAEVREARETRRDDTAPRRESRPATLAPEKTTRGRKKEEAPAGDVGADVDAAREEDEIVEAAAPEQPDDRDPEEPRNGEQAEVLVAATAPVWEVAQPVALPVLEGLVQSPVDATGEQVEVDVEVVVGGAAVEPMDDPLLSGPLGGGGILEEAGLAEATDGRSVIADRPAREAFVAALEQAQAGKTETSAEDAREEAPLEAASIPVEQEGRVERLVGGSSRQGASVEPVLRGAGEAAAFRASEIGRERGGAETDLGSDEFSRGRGEAMPQPVVKSAESGNPAASAAVSAALEGATAGLSEAAPSSPDLAAGQSIEITAPTAPTRAPELPPALQTARSLPTSAPDAIAAQADWLATRGGGTARLVLNPPELGEIAIRVTVRQQAVEVVMVAQTALAHSMAEEQGDRLSHAFAQRDLRLEHFEIRRGDPSDSSGTGQFGSSDAGARERERAQDEREVDRGRVDGRGMRRSGSGEAVGVRPLPVGSNGRAAGIDLRI